jgi:hypothetical protein
MKISDQLNKIELRLKNFNDETNKDILLRTISNLLITLSKDSDITTELNDRINQIQANIRDLEAGLNEAPDESDKKQSATEEDSAEDNNDDRGLSHAAASAIGADLEDEEWEIVTPSSSPTTANHSSFTPSSMPSTMPTSTGYIEFSGNIFQKGNFHGGSDGNDGTF